MTAEVALEESEKRLAADLEAMTRLQKLGTLFLHEGNLESVLTEIVDGAIAIAGADFGNIQLLDPESSRLRIAAHRGFPTWWIDFWKDVPERQGVCGTAIERGERVIVEDVLQSPIFVGTDALEIQIKAGVRAVQSTPLVSRSGRLLGMFSTHYKTPRRPDDRALRLLDLLARLTADIIEQAQAEGELLHAKAAAEAANVAKSQFLASMSHELRTPMNAILGMTDLALDAQLPSNVRDYLQTSKESADLLLELLNEILDFSRIEAGRFELESAPVRLRKTVEQVVKTLGVRAYEKGLEVVYQVADELPDMVVGDPLRLRQVLMNLVNNAIKFTPKGEVVVQAAVEQRTAEAVVGTVLRVGHGDRHRAGKIGDGIFAPFTQADSSTTRRCRRHRPGFGHLATAGQLDGWAHSGRKSAGQRQHVPFHPCTADCRAGGRQRRSDCWRSGHLPRPAGAGDWRERYQPENPSANARQLVDGGGRGPGRAERTDEDSRGGGGLAGPIGWCWPMPLCQAPTDSHCSIGLQQDQRLAGSVILMLSATDRQNHPDQCRELKALCVEKPVLAVGIVLTLLRRRSEAKVRFP